ncbi:MAG TPA: outer membrane lipoprotein-sorting protein [Candidatus Nitrosopolaris sp.]|nr:outer membrane lipoprotein-sorting protein [Candidatus Nitrosopolaris sp.]
MTVSRRSVLASLALSALLTAPASAEPPPVEALVAKMRAVVWQAQPSVRTLTVRVTTPQFGGESTQSIAKQARKKLADGGRMLTVMQAPAGVQGMAWLIQEGPKQGKQWVWDPVFRRVRTLIPLEGYEVLWSSDFTYADLGLVDLHSTYKLLGEEQHDGVQAYKVQEVPRSQWYYTRIVTWIAANSSFPLERQFYDPANQLWKVERFDQVTEINGIPTVLHRRMEDRQTGSSTDINVSDVNYGADIPDALFDPAKLPQAADSPALK